MLKQSKSIQIQRIKINDNKKRGLYRVFCCQEYNVFKGLKPLCGEICAI